MPAERKTFRSVALLNVAEFFPCSRRIRQFIGKERLQFFRTALLPSDLQLELAPPLFSVDYRPYSGRYEKDSGTARTPG